MKIFLSHSSKDKAIVRTLKDDLNQNGIATWLDEDSLELGDSLLESITVAIEGTTHFAIILTPNSVNSEWVTTELSRAEKGINNGLLTKVIPIKLRECSIPKFLQGKLYGDLSSEVVKNIDHGKVKFISSGYDEFLLKLIKTIKSDKGKLIENQSQLLANANEVEQRERVPVSSQSIHGVYNLLRYKTKERRLLYAERALKGLGFKKTKSIELDQILPILLPHSWQLLFKNLNVGDTINIHNGVNFDPLFKNLPFKFSSSGQIAGFRRDDLAITFDPRVRKACDLTPGHIHEVGFDSISKELIITQI